MKLRTGDRVGHYTIVAPLGRGGMGEVYHAHDPRLARDVAIKLLSDSAAAPGERRQRFEREARAVARLNHPNIVTLHDVGERDGALFLVTELLEGSTLRRRLEGGPLPWTVAAGWAAALLDGLAAAHDRGIVHRDLKPENVWITRDERVKILDFGIAKIVDAPAGGDQLTVAAAASPTGAQVLGTVGYMSPEQVRGEAVDGRSDIFSLGAMLHEMVTGHRPFERHSALVELHAILHDEAPPLTSMPGCPPALAGILQRCFAKQPSMRFASARDLAVALHGAAVVPARGQPSARERSADPEQRIAYCVTRDGVRIAYATIGRGPLLVRVLGWFTHLEREWAWPELRELWERLAATHTVVRYDGRGIGLSDRWSGEFTEETRLLDLEAVLDAVAPGTGALFGISEGGWTAGAFAIQHPARVSHLVIYGGYARGASSRPGFDAEEDRALLTLMRKGWGRETPAFRQVFTSQFYREDCDPEVVAHFNEMQRASADPETAARYVASCHSRQDGTSLFSQVATPTLVVHRRDDRSVAFEEGRYLASVVPGAEFLPLRGSAHYFPTGRAVANEPGSIDLADAITSFLERTALR